MQGAVVYQLCQPIVRGRGLARMCSRQGASRSRLSSSFHPYGLLYVPMLQDTTVVVVLEDCIY